MHYKDEVNDKEDSFSVPYNTIEPNWRFLDRHNSWCFNRVLGGVPIAFRYRKAESRNNVVDGLKCGRSSFNDRYPAFAGRVKIVARWPFYILLQLRNEVTPMSAEWMEEVAPMHIFHDWHEQNFRGSGRHEDPSRPEYNTLNILTREELLPHPDLITGRLDDPGSWSEETINIPLRTTTMETTPYTWTTTSSERTSGGTSRVEANDIARDIYNRTYNRASG